MISSLILLTLLTLHPDTWMIFLQISNVYFDNMVSKIYPSELQLKLIPLIPKPRFKTCSCPFPNDIVATKIYDNLDYFDFEIVNFPFLDCDVPRSTPYGVYIFQFIRFARSSSHVADLTLAINRYTQKLLKQGYR